MFVIDKDFKELDVLREQFPSASVILCHFYVIDHLRQGIAKGEYHLNPFQKVHMRNFVVRMVRASTADEF